MHYDVPIWIRGAAMTALDALLKQNLLNPTTLLGAIFYALVFIVLAILGARLVRLGATKALERDYKQVIDRTVADFLVQLAQIGIYLIAFILYAHLIPELRALGTALLAGVSVASITIALAAQNTLGNLIAGIALMLYRPFRVGDQVQISAPAGLETGTIESLALGHTVLQTFDNRSIVVPNSVMISQITINLTNSRALAQVPISIDYAANIEQARCILLDLAENHTLVQEVLGCPVTHLENAAVTLSLRAWCANIGDAMQVEFDLYEQAKEQFERDGIERPPNQTVLLEKRAERNDA
jgi:small conductance mechanosensitive channel